ncbi:MAG: hypothetical protein MUO77_13295, partial [Anaerolineales bacterium]|nr:hypothetical protein [Anaerolineales bacterium]
GASVLLPDDALLKQMLVEAATLSPRAVELTSIKIELQNGSPFDTYDGLASSRLNYAGYETIISPADNRNYTNSVIVDFTPAQDPNQRSNIRNVLGLFSASELSIPNPNSPVQYRVILGYDYEPCFKPEQLSH